MTTGERPLEWIASSYKDLLALPPNVRRRFGYALSLAQMGDHDDNAKILTGFGDAGVLEVIENATGGTYRAVYTVRFAEAGFCPALLPEKESSRYCDSKSRHGHHSRPTESGSNASTGVKKCSKPP